MRFGRFFKSYRTEVEATVRRGFPVLVRAKICPPERDVGIMSSYVDDIEVLTMAGKSADFLKLKDSELDDLAVVVLEKARHKDEDFYL